MSFTHCARLGEKMVLTSDISYHVFSAAQSLSQHRRQNDDESTNGVIASTSHCFDHHSYACCYDVVDGGPGLQSDHDDDDEADGDDHDHDVHDCDVYHDSFDPDGLCPRNGYNQTDDFSASPHLAVDEGMWKFFE